MFFRGPSPCGYDSVRKCLLESELNKGHRRNLNAPAAAEIASSTVRTDGNTILVVHGNQKLQNSSLSASGRL